jgi:hypothetical protein
LAGSDESAKYIRDNWLPTLKMWANCSHEHSALLLQVLTTNPNEAFHRSLKSLANITKLTIRPKYSLADLIALIAQCTEQYDARAQMEAYNWSHKKLSSTLKHPWLENFRYQVQLLLLAEIEAAEKLTEADEPPFLLPNGACEYKFARSYWLPCRHVIYTYEFLGSIEEPNWSEFAELFEESGFDIYYTRGLVEVDEDHIDALSHNFEAKLFLSETLNQIRTRFYEVTEFSDTLTLDKKERLLKRWRDELTNFSSNFIGQSFSE